MYKLSIGEVVKGPRANGVLGGGWFQVLEGRIFWLLYTWSFDCIKHLYSLVRFFFISTPVCVGYGSQEVDSLVAFDRQLFYVGDEGVFWVKSNA